MFIPSVKAKVKTTAVTTTRIPAQQAAPTGLPDAMISCLLSTPGHSVLLCFALAIGTYFCFKLARIS